ncbi:MAG: hypothetical protein ACPGN3_01160 [Opitutales bacterium]
MYASLHSLSYARRLISGLLAVWLFLATLGTVSPAMHAWLHGHAHDGESCGEVHHHGEVAHDEEHVCAVTILASDASAPAAAVSLVFESSLFYQAISYAEQIDAQGKDLYTRSRAPPIDALM